MAGMNGAMAPEVRTVFLPAAPQSRHITATLVRQIATMGGDISPFVPASVAKKIARKLAQIRPPPRDVIYEASSLPRLAAFGRERARRRARRARRPE